MNYASHKENSTQLPASSQAAHAVYAELANGLHAMAQPLTILRGALGAMSLAPTGASGQERYLDMSNKQMDRLCDMMAGLQGLLDAALFEARCCATELWETVEPVVEEVAASLRDAGIRIETTRPDQSVLAVADAGRLEQSVRAALKTAASVSHRDDVIQFDIRELDGWVELLFRAQGAPGKRLSSPDHLSLALVESSTLSQLGVYRCSEDPLCISVSLPMQPRDPGIPGMKFPCSTVRSPGASAQPLHSAAALNRA